MKFRKFRNHVYEFCQSEDARSIQISSSRPICREFLVKNPPIWVVRPVSLNNQVPPPPSPRASWLKSYFYCFTIDLFRNLSYICCGVVKLKLLPRYYHSFLPCFPFGPSLTSSARNQIQMAPALLNCWLLHSVKFETRMSAVQELTFQTRRSHLNLIWQASKMWIRPPLRWPVLLKLELIRSFLPCTL